MSTHTDNSGGDARRAAVEAGRGADAWEAALAAQQRAVPEHGGFYAVAAEMVTTLRRLGSLCEVLTVQVSAYGHTVTARGEVLRDDVAGHDPGERIAIASSWAAQTGHHLAVAEQAANRFWSEVGHVAAEPTEDGATS